ncbi:hypothetical protein N2W54_004181 [Lotmaria passim]
MSLLSSRAGQRRRSLFVTFFTVALALCLCSYVVVSLVAATPEGPHISPVVQCRRDFSAMCSDTASVRELWGCMMKNVENISNDVCRDYVKGFRACTLDAEKKGSCVSPAADYATSVRRCLRNLPEANISQECLNSRFYFPIAEARHAKW